MSRWSTISPIPPAGDLRTLSWATLTNTLGSGLWLAGSALYLTRGVGLSAPAVGVALTVGALVGLTASLPFGRLADRYDPRTLRAALQITQAAVAAAYLLVGSVTTLIVVAVLDALLTAGNLAVRAALVAVVAGPRDRVTAFATLRAVANLGIGVGAAAAGVALTVDTLLAYQFLVIGNASTYAISALLVLRLPRTSRPSTLTTPRRSLLGPALRDLPFLAVSTASAVLTLHHVVLTLIIPLWVVSHTSAPAGVVSAILVTNTVLTVLLAVRLSRAVDTATTAARTVRRAGLVLAVAMLLYATSGHLPAVAATALLLLTTVVYTIGDLWHSVSGARLAYDLADPDAIGEYQGVDQLLSGTVRAAGPALLTLLILTGGVAGWAATAALLAVAGLLTPRIAAWALRTRRPAAPASASRRC
ncbi:MFS transporter [Micromonospora echinofusca]|uniref:MFS transporter n=1 Tax=Micromonospora echinofusca TaxID=47858 RepID=A0ABS3VQG4_MICEH|nr:MFS transporter [Micromonospora echinofusca]MBO4206745.1 MFS transporter [Micromonospora echinofusca]